MNVSLRGSWVGWQFTNLNPLARFPILPRMCIHWKLISLIPVKSLMRLHPTSTWVVTRVVLSPDLLMLLSTLLVSFIRTRVLWIIRLTEIQPMQETCSYRTRSCFKQMWEAPTTLSKQHVNSVSKRSWLLHPRQHTEYALPKGIPSTTHSHWKKTMTSTQKIRTLRSPSPLPRLAQS